MKLKIELSCVESELLDALYSTKTIMKAMDITFIQVKVLESPHNVNGHYTSSNRHSWVHVTEASNPTELVKIYELEKKIKELETPLET